MISRVLIVAAIAVSLAGCSNSSAGLLNGLQTSTLQAPLLVSASSMSQSDGLAVAEQVDKLRLTKKTMASKVTAAIALERVTGRQADPSRLAEALE